MKYFSWTRLDTFERNWRDYVKYYILYEERVTTPAMEFGAKLSKALEWGEDTDDKSINALIPRIPKLEVMEWEVNVQSEVIPVPLMIQLDSANKDLKAFKEYKTGKPWTQNRVDKHGQIDFYCTVIWLKTGFIPEDIELISLPTEVSPWGYICATGHIIPFKTQRKMQDIFSMTNRIKKAYQGMVELEKQYKKS